MKIYLLTAALGFITITSYSQIANDMMISGGFDLIKTDASGVFEKAQIGTEFNYFLDRKFTATAGFELWTYNKPSFVIGGRWYPIDELFLRARGLIGENDISIGAGWSKPLNDNFRFEAIGDFYFKIDFSVRAGISYVIRRK
jgi:hypothetical protein